MRLILIRALCVLALLALAACGKPSPESAGATPDGAINAAVDHLRSGDFAQFVIAALPPAEVERMRADWKNAMQGDPPGEEETRDFRESLANMNDPEAVDVLMAKLEPRLVKFETETAPLMPTAIEVGRGLLLSGIEKNGTLTAEQKAEAVAMVDAIENWVTRTPFTDRARVREAVTHLVESARALEISELDQLRALTLDEALAKGGIAWAGARKALGVYGLSIDEALANTRAETVKTDGDTATVRIRSQFLGKPISANVEMVRVDGRWYGKPLIDGIAARNAAAGATAPAAG
jgi:hypothetical protein